MNKNEWNAGLNHIDSDLVEEYVAQKDNLTKKKKRGNVWLHFGAAAACFCIIIGALIGILLLRQPNPDVNPCLQASSSAPQYYGSEASVGDFDPNQEVNTTGISVTARWKETLPDTYTFFDDWNQYEFRLLRMEVVTLLRGQEMTDEFYYMIPVDYMTDFSRFHQFVILGMAQYGYEYSVLYNKTQECAEQLNLVLFGYVSYNFNLLGEKLMAFDSDGNFDVRLWEANEAWIAGTKNAFKPVDTIQQAEEAARQETGYADSIYVHLLKDISSEAADALSKIKSFENGVFVPNSYGYTHHLTPEVQFHAVRYINGFRTNEQISIYSKDWNGGDADIVYFSKARFQAEDFNALPNLAAAITSVASAYDAGEITPPHIQNVEELTLLQHGILGWYAKTESGIIGIVRVTWRYLEGNLDDMYYIVEYGADACEPIDRDALLERFGDHETTYIYNDAYDENGKMLAEVPYA